MVDKRAELLKLQEEIEREDKENRARQSKKWKKIVSKKENWEWKVWDIEDGKKIKVAKRVIPNLVKEWEKDGFSTFSNDFQDAGQWQGMFYYRTDEGILTSDSGGYCVLQIPKLCSDEEWEKMRKGGIPEKFKRED